MNTDDLINDLGCRPPQKLVPTPTAMVLGAALLSLFVALALSLLWLKPRNDLAIPLIVDNHVFFLKLVFTTSVVVAALPIVRDLAVPGRRITSASILAAIPLTVIMALALRELVQRTAGTWPYHSDHATLECLWQIPALAVPAFFILAAAVRRLGPTDLTRAGAYIGLLAGGIGALGYAFHCHHDSVAFVATAYTLAILESALLGALVGRHMLRWV